MTPALWLLAFAAEIAARRLRHLLALAAEALLSWVLHASLDGQGRPVMLAPPSAAPLAGKPAVLPRAPASWCETTVIDIDLLTRIRPHVAASVPVRWLP